MITDRRFVAVHEAGHAIVGMALGLNMYEIRINEDGGGHCIAYNSSRPRSIQAAYNLGGVLACALYCRDHARFTEWANWDHCHVDREYFDVERSGTTYRQGRRAALEILREREAELLALADVLERDGVVTHENAP